MNYEPTGPGWRVWEYPFKNHMQATAILVDRQMKVDLSEQPTGPYDSLARQLFKTNRNGTYGSLPWYPNQNYWGVLYGFATRFLP